MFEDIKVGDEVFLFGHSLDVHPARVKVTRVLKRQIEVAENRYSKIYGKPIGGGSTYVEAITEEVERRLAHRQAIEADKDAVERIGKIAASMADAAFDVRARHLDEVRRSHRLRPAELAELVQVFRAAGQMVEAACKKFKDGETVGTGATARRLGE